MVRGKGSMRDKKKVSEHPNYTLILTGGVVEKSHGRPYNFYHLQLYKKVQVVTIIPCAFPQPFKNGFISILIFAILTDLLLMVE